VMGLPGDTNLELLHYIGCTDMHWGETANHLLSEGKICLFSLEVGNSNELNAAYAADGYSRIKGSPGVSELHYLLDVPELAGTLGRRTARSCDISFVRLSSIGDD
jgi:TPP-dependent 2-oxoacid decarboxylase